MFKYCWFLLVFLFAEDVFAQNPDPNLGLIPAPVSVKIKTGQFLLHKRSIVQSELKDDRSVAFLNSYLQKLPDNSVKNDTASSVIELTSIGSDTTNLEAYHLRISPKKITIIGKDAGLFYGVQSVIQLLADAKSNGTYAVNCAEIEDYPRFKYRGMHLDVSRHFFPASFIREYLDLLATYKINTFHWHLTDDQGWRIEIKKYPKLTEVGSMRAQTLIGNSHARPKQFDGTPYGGFYTQDEIREIVKYAAERYITVIPEIEMPGHSQAALASYPELSCNPKKVYKVAETWGVFDNVYCPSEYTFTFLE
ncbi:MAG: beta-N-acetylhexosaminidase, partial [Sphingobacteriaceae bacterium]